MTQRTDGIVGIPSDICEICYHPFDQCSYCSPLKVDAARQHAEEELRIIKKAAKAFRVEDAIASAETPSDLQNRLRAFEIAASLRIDLAKADAARQRAEEARDMFQRKYSDESMIVDEVCGALGISTYEQAGGKHIATIVRERCQQLAAAEEARAQLEPYVQHKHDCETRTEEDYSCTCGLAALVQARPPETDV